MSSLATKAIHAGEARPRPGFSVAMPIFQSAQYEDDLIGGDGAVHYIRYGNTPNQRVLNEKIAALEGAEDAQVSASGMGAISAALMALLKPGDHLLAQAGLYGGTHFFVTGVLKEFGVAVDFIDPNAAEEWEQLIRPTTRAVYVESISNPLVQVADLEAVVQLAKRHGLVSIIDNTFATPIGFRPIELGFDLVLHSATKALNGHSDIVAGVAVGSRELVGRVRSKIKSFGSSLDPNSCFLLQRGIRTLPLRVRFQNESTQRLAEFFDAHPAVSAVHYPGLATHPQHERAERLFDGFGSVVTIELAGGAEEARRFVGALELPFNAPSLGSMETLVTRPAATSHVDLTQEERDQIGISDGLVRISVGAEDTDDLIADFDQALAQLTLINTSI